MELSLCESEIDYDKMYIVSLRTTNEKITKSNN